MRTWPLFALVLLLSVVLSAQSPSGDQQTAKPQSDAKPQDKAQNDATQKGAAQDTQHQKQSAVPEEKIYDPGKNGVTRPVPIFTELPEMPEKLRRAHMNDDRKGNSKRFTGAVVLAGYLDKRGRTHNLAVVRSLSKEADKAALDAVKRWKFRPCTKDGEPVNCYIGLEISFNLP